MKEAIRMALAVVVIVVAVAAHAQPNPPQPSPPRPGAPQSGAPQGGPAEPDRPTADPVDLVRHITETTGMEFVLDPRVGRRMYIGDASVDDIDFESLQAILRINGYFTAEIGGKTFVLPAQLARQIPTRLVQRDDPSISDHEIVTRIIQVDGRQRQGGAEGAPSASAMLVPVLRPLLPVEAHLAAVGDSLIVVDRYDNVRRITELVNMLKNDL